jgi:Phasin protein
MNTQENTQVRGLRAQIKNASQFVQDAAVKSETAVLDVVERAEAALGTAQSSLNTARQFGGEVAGAMGHAGRTTINGVVEFNTALGRFGKDAVTDMIEVGRKTAGAKSVKEAVELYVDYVSRRGQAMFAQVNELNAIAQSKTVAAWAPFGETLRKAGDKVTA